MNRRPMTEAEKEQARADYMADRSVSIAQLADEYGVSRTVMQRALRGVARPPGGVVKATINTEQMWRMRSAGLTLEQIGRQAGLTRAGVSRRLSANREAV